MIDRLGAVFADAILFFVDRAAHTVIRAGVRRAVAIRVVIDGTLVV